MLKIVASNWCFHLLIYDARNHENEKNIYFYVVLLNPTCQGKEPVLKFKRRSTKEPHLIYNF